MENPALTTWKKSSYSNSNGGDCVEVALFPAGDVGLRDSKHPGDGHLTLSPDAFRAFLGTVRRADR
ncbi:DUF397 domain-containing protein [Sphaerisporangium aureirubrum]|uniref:DUF397 domain-containing protein n=1 Tax=Sphaerisporangium aureirubrum TaxID=1544736 RepID=A0ABW1NY57_9ACTN